MYLPLDIYCVLFIVDYLLQFFLNWRFVLVLYSLLSFLYIFNDFASVTHVYLHLGYILRCNVDRNFKGIKSNFKCYQIKIYFMIIPQTFLKRRSTTHKGFIKTLTGNREEVGGGIFKNIQTAHEIAHGMKVLILT